MPSLFSVLPDAALWFLVAFAWIHAGLAKWELICQADARMNPEEHRACLLQHDLRNGRFLAHFAKATFIAFWPAWFALSFILQLTWRSSKGK